MSTLSDAVKVLIIRLCLPLVHPSFAATLEHNGSSLCICTVCEAWLEAGASLPGSWSTGVVTTATRRCSPHEGTHLLMSQVFPCEHELPWCALKSATSSWPWCDWTYWLLGVARVPPRIPVSMCVWWHCALCDSCWASFLSGSWLSALSVKRTTERLVLNQHSAGLSAVRSRVRISPHAVTLLTWN